ncbi:MAG: AI-2E family transporter [Patescibacteria group bacterium]
MNRHQSERYFLLILLALIFILTFFIFRPFLYALVLAIVFATVFAPLHRRALTLTAGRKSSAALLSTGIVLIIVVVPISLLGRQIFQEAGGLYSALVGSGGPVDLTRGLNEIFLRFTSFSPQSIASLELEQYLSQGLSWLLEHLGSLFANLARALIGIFIFLVALYYSFRDGDQLARIIISLSPLEDNHDQTIFDKLSLAINSVIRGNLAVAVIQGLLTAVGFAIFGVPNAVLWGSAAAVAALIPSVGTALVLLPGILYLYFNDATLPAVGLLVWGMLAVGLIDNFLGPKLVGRGVHLHPFLILLSILGGIIFFGPIGFLMGPLTLSLLFALLEIYFSINREPVGQ